MNNKQLACNKRTYSSCDWKQRNPKSIEIETKFDKKMQAKQKKKMKREGVKSFYARNDDDSFFEEKHPVGNNDENKNNDINKSIDNCAPSNINVYEYAESRAFEIMNLQKALAKADTSKNGRVFQRLPKHMRRRAASHDIRRIPKRVRAEAENENVEPKKPPSRKYKRRPRNLMKEYNRRSKLHSWLETHIWHAKRFKMVSKWGYRLAEKPCDKAFRAIFRASAKSCVLQDKSYMEVIEIVGPQDEIIHGFERMTNPDCMNDGVLKDEDCLSGRCYAEEIVYKCCKYPDEVIGSVKFIWVPAKDVSHRKLIIICHPSISTELTEEIKLVFTADNNTLASNVSHVDESSHLSDYAKNEYLSCAEKQVDGSHASITDGKLLTGRENLSLLENEGSGDTAVEEPWRVGKISILHHRLDFAIFSLTGPMSFRILQNVFTYLPSESSVNADEENASESQKLTGNDNELWKHACKSALGKRFLYSLSVEDPRFHLPYKKKNPFHIEDKVSSFHIKSEEQCCQPSLLWDSSARRKLKEEKEKLCDDYINKLRSKLLIPGSSLHIESPAIPVVVMHRPGRSVLSDIEGHRNNYGSGFDVIIPGGWGMPFWMALVYQGVHVGGRESDEHISFEALSMYLPTQYPDSKSRKKQAATLLKERTEKYERYPPDKRINYQRLGILHPFFTPWRALVAEWEHMIRLLLAGDEIVKDELSSSDCKSYYVLREQKILNHLRSLIRGDLTCDNREDVLRSLAKHPHSLVPVYVTPLQDGVPKDNATLCIPTKEDFMLLNNKDTYAEKWSGPDEPLHKGLKSQFPYICHKHDLLLPNAPTIGGNTRWVLGYVQTGGYSFSKGQGIGMGFVSMIGLIYLLISNKDNLMLLFRNTNTLEYRFCNLHVLY